MATSSSLRVALTLEQSWHRVPGGTAVAALGMVKALAARNDTSTVGVAAKHLADAPEAWRAPIEVRQLPLPRVALYESWHRFRRPRVELATGRVDVIHATTIAMPPRTVPVVMTIHDLAFMHDPGHFTPRGLRFFHKGLELALAEADHIVCPSEATAIDCREAGFEADRVTVVPLGVDAKPATREEIREVRRRHGLDAAYILWTGTIEPRKNLPRLLEAYRSLDDSRVLVLVGPTGWNEDLDRLIGDLGARVRPLGFVPHAELGPLYAGADAFCFPSLREGFGFPVLEAMAQGTPVVTSRGTSTEEIAGGAGILVDPLDAASIADGLRKALNEPELAENLARAGRERAGQFTWSRCAKGLIDLYREVLS